MGGATTRMRYYTCESYVAETMQRYICIITVRIHLTFVCSLLLQVLGCWTESKQQTKHVPYVYSTAADLISTSSGPALL